MAIEHWELMQECFPNTQTCEQQGWNKIKKLMKQERREACEHGNKTGTKKRNPNGLSVPNQNTIIINKICYYFIRYGISTIKFK